MSPERQWKLYFDDLLGFCEKVISYTDGLTREKFEASGLNYDATLWNVLLYGEAAKNIPEQIRSQMPDSLARIDRHAQPVGAWVFCHQQHNSLAGDYYRNAKVA